MQNRNGMKGALGVGLLFTMALSGFCVPDVVSIWGGARGTVVRKSDGAVWTWGANFSGKLGIGMSSTNLSSVLVPTEVHGEGDTGFFNSSIVMVAARDWHNIAVKADGSVWQWGANDQGQCGDNTTIDRWSPVQVSGLGPRVGLLLQIAPSSQPGQVDLSWSSGIGHFSTWNIPLISRQALCHWR